MKNRNTKFKMAFLLSMVTCFSLLAGNPENGNKEGALQLYCSEPQTELAEILAGQYMKVNPDVLIQVRTPGTITGEELAEASAIVLGNKACLANVDRNEDVALVVGRDVIVPIISAKNPYVDLIRQQGMNLDQFTMIYAAGSPLSWGEVLGTGSAAGVKAMVPANACERAYIEAYLGTETEVETATNPDEMVKKVGANPLSIGFCNLACLTKLEREGGSESIALVPIDVNGNGELSHIEDIYGNFQELGHGIYVGKYPSELYTRIYALASAGRTPQGTAFMEWLLSDGQEQVALAGILPAEYSEKTAGLRALTPVPEELGVEKENRATLILLVVLAMALLAPVAWLIIKPAGSGLSEKKKTTVAAEAFKADESAHPAGLLYDQSHTWAIMEQDGLARIGLDAFVPGITGKLTRMEMKNAGEQVQKGEVLLTLVQDGKRLEIKSPVSGEISSCNEEMSGNPSLLYTAPYEEGWLYRMKPSVWKAETNNFLMVDDYSIWLKGEVSRLKDFFASEFSAADGSEKVILQDGGMLMEGALGECDPRTWENFQAKFLK